MKHRVRELYQEKELAQVEMLGRALKVESIFSAG